MQRNFIVTSDDRAMVLFFLIVLIAGEEVVGARWGAVRPAFELAKTIDHATIDEFELSNPLFELTEFLDRSVIMAGLVGRMRVESVGELNCGLAGEGARRARCAAMEGGRIAKKDGRSDRRLGLSLACLLVGRRGVVNARARYPDRREDRVRVRDRRMDRQRPSGLRRPPRRNRKQVAVGGYRRVQSRLACTRLERLRRP